MVKPIKTIKNIEFEIKVLKRKKSKARSLEESKRCEKEILDLEKEMAKLKTSTPSLNLKLGDKE